MPSVVRSTFVLSAFAFAAVSAITACGDKVNVTQPAKDSSVQSVLVSPPGPVAMKIGDKVTFAASVTGGPDLTNRAVTWTSSATNIATVDQNGVVTAVAGGTASIIAASKQNPAVTGAAVVSVGATVAATVTISSINQGGVPANLGNIQNQLDVTLNVDPGTQTISEVDLIMNCGGADTIVARQTLSSANVIPASELNSLVEAAASPVTLSFNTAAFNSTTGVIAFKNGACNLKAKAITSSGSQVASSSTAITLNNVDGVIVTTTNSGNSATDGNGLPWKSGNITVAALPVLYSGRTPANVTITLPGANLASITGPASTTGTTSVTWSASSATSPSIKGLTLFNGFDANNFQRPVHPSVLIVDSNGNDLNLGQLNPTSVSDMRIDNQAPDISGGNAVVYTANTQNTSANWVGTNFTFTKAITLTAGTKADNNGVDVVTFATQWSPTGAGTWTTFTSPTQLAETANSTSLDLRAMVCDKLQNCVNSPVLTQFGVDLTAPTASTLTGPKANEIVGLGGALSAGGITINASDPQGANGVQGSGFGPTPVLATETQLAPSGATGQTLNCVIGTPTNPVGTGCSATASLGLAFAVSTASPGQYALSYTVTDQAGNQSGAVASQYYIDASAPPQMTGGLSIPASITTGSVFTASGTDDMDFASVNAVLTYPAMANLMIPGTSSATGVAFDNVLTRASTATVTLANFIRSLGQFDGAGNVVGAQTKPTQISIRGVDAANNLSVGDVGVFPANNISNPANLAGTTSGFTLAAAPTALCNASGNCNVANAPRATTLTATVNATSLTAASPFSQVCFYVANPAGASNAQADPVSQGAAGELFLLSCTSVQTTQPGGPNGKVIVSTASFDPDVKYGTAATLNVFVIGITANGDGMLAAAPVTITTTP